MPMCGVPYHAADGYIARLVHQGTQGGHLRADGGSAAGEEAGAPRGDAGGDASTAADSQLLAPQRTTSWPPPAVPADRIGLACVDLSTGEFRATEMSGDDA